MKRPSVLIVVQNLPVPLDRRVWLECQALRDAGYDVAVICPKGPGDPGHQVLDGISLYKYRGAPATQGLLSYLLEFAYCWFRTALISLKVYRRHRFSVFQACNPPDTYWLLGAFWRRFGVKYVFDHHDLNPELFRSRFGDPVTFGAKAQFGVLSWLERRTYQTADHVIVTNESYRGIALGRGKRLPEDVTVVRSGPNTSQMRPVPGRPELRKGADYLLAYIGIMGPQDNVDILLDAMKVLVHEIQRTDVHLVLMGFGDCLESLKAQSHDLGLDDYVTFTGRADQNMIADYLSTAHVGLAPDLKTPLNDLSTHNKTMEYMAFALPVVSFDLDESRRSAADSAIYVESGDVAAFAKAVNELLDEPERRVEMSRAARQRCVTELDWEPQAKAYVQVFDTLLRREQSAASAALPASIAAGRARPIDRRQDSDSVTSALPVVAGRETVGLRAGESFETFLHTRGVPADGQADEWDDFEFQDLA